MFEEKYTFEISNKQSALKTSPAPTSERGAGLIKPFSGKLPQKYRIGKFYWPPTGNHLDIVSLIIVSSVKHIKMFGLF